MMRKVICTRDNSECIGKYLCKYGRQFTGPCPYAQHVWLHTTTEGIGNIESARPKNIFNGWDAA